ncbi:MAG: hypothetical protein M1832_004478 [Thelocarpon impressellum]|nr:MAG: hypothetical protein M1832_004478 [Thelocarpon impressellum]
MPTWSSLQPLLHPSLPEHCEPTGPFLVFLSSSLHTCIPTPLALVSTTLGCLSIASWLFAQLPQIFKNYALQSTSGLSIYFLVEWCLGDSTNLLGALLTRQASWQVVVAGYYVFVDVILVWQYVWYTHLRPRSEARRRLRSDWVLDEDDQGPQPMGRMHEHVIDGVPAADDVQPAGRSFPRQTKGEEDEPDKTFRGNSIPPPACSTPPSKEEAVNSAIETMGHGRGPHLLRARSMFPPSSSLLVVSMLGGLASAHPTPLSALTAAAAPLTPSRMEMLGRLLSWSSTLLYLCSRLPQIYKNHVRQSTAGLSAKLFIAAFFGNLFYSSSLLTDPCAWSDMPAYGGHGWVGRDGNQRSDWVARAAPFWLGAAGVLGLDATVGAQFLMFGEGQAREIAEDSKGRWQAATGWMRGWVPGAQRVRLGGSTGGERERERERLISGDAGSYGTA